MQLKKEGLRYRLNLAFEDGVNLPYMAWTSGQREFTPLLLGLLDVLPPRSRKKLPSVDWVVIEEPEMGLHPEAIAVVMLLALDLLWRGYKVVISTHSPLVLDVVWAVRRLSQFQGDSSRLCDAFGVSGSAAMRAVLEHALQAEYRVYFARISHKSGRVGLRDISALDPAAGDTSEATWGGLTGFSSRVGEAVREAVNAAETA